MVSAAVVAEANARCDSIAHVTVWFGQRDGGRDTATMVNHATGTAATDAIHQLYMPLEKRARIGDGRSQIGGALPRDGQLPRERDGERLPRLQPAQLGEQKCHVVIARPQAIRGRVYGIAAARRQRGSRVGRVG